MSGAPPPVPDRVKPSIHSSSDIDILPPSYNDFDDAVKQVEASNNLAFQNTNFSHTVDAAYLLNRIDTVDKRCNLLELKIAQLENDKIELQSRLNNYIRSQSNTSLPHGTLVHTVGAINQRQCQSSGCRHISTSRCTYTQQNKQCNRLVCNNHATRITSNSNHVRVLCPQHKAVDDDCTIM